MALRLFFTVFLSSIIAVVMAQQPATFHVRQYGTEDGLPSNGIKGLQWDKLTGFLWIATEAGMVRFNGMTFKTYTSDDNPHITNERILFLVRNNAGTIYTADNTGNIFSVNKNTLSFYKKKIITGNSRSNIITLPVSETFYNAGHEIVSGPFALQFNQVLPESDTSCYIVRGGLLFYFSVSMSTPQPLHSPVGGVSGIFKCRDELFTFDHQNNPWQISRSAQAFTKTEFHFGSNPQKPDFKKGSFFWENGMENPVFITGDKAWNIILLNGKLTAQLICNRVPQDVLIRYVQYDSSAKTLFIGTDSKGLIIIRQNRVEAVKKERTSPDERTSYYSQVELPDGSVMTNEGHVFGKSATGGADFPFNRGFSISTFMMGDSVFWFVKFNTDLRISCLHSYNFRTKQLTPYRKIRENFYQLAMVQSGGRLYVASESGIFRMQGDSLERIYEYPELDKLRIHFDAREVEPGVLVIANCNALLRYIVSSGKMETLYAAGKYCVRTIWVYKDYVFFGTYGNGLYAIRNGKVKRMPLDKNRHLLFTHCFVDDGNGYCWISTNRGLFKANIEELVNAYETDAPQVYYHYYGRNDGMEMTEMNGGCMPCGVMLKNKTISFPTMEGLLWVNPKNAIPVLPDGEIFIDEVLVDNQRTSLLHLEEEPLAATSHDIQFRLGFSAWCNKENIYLQYQLNGEGEWKTVNTDNGAVIQFSNLKRGDYSLRIRKLNGFGVNNYSYKEIRFTIPTPWHQRWWFYLLAGLFAWSVLAVYFRYRTRQFKLRQRRLELQVAEKTKELQQQNEILEKNNSIKTRLISIISHDIVTPLKFVTVAGNKLLEKKTQMPEELQLETIREMTNTSQELQFLSTNILNWIKYQNENRRLVKETFNLHEMVSQVLGILHSLARQKNLTVENRVDGRLEIYQYYEPLKILVYNLLTNAIHFTEKGIISVSAAQEGEYICVTVRDEGSGMTPEQIQRLMADEVVITAANVDNKRGHGLGYLIIKDLVKTMGAVLHIESKREAGTAVSVKMPGKKNGSGSSIV